MALNKGKIMTVCEGTVVTDLKSLSPPTLGLFPQALLLCHLAFL